MEAFSDELDEILVETVATFEPYMYEPLATVNSHTSHSDIASAGMVHSRLTNANLRSTV